VIRASLFGPDYNRADNKARISNPRQLPRARRSQIGANILPDRWRGSVIRASLFGPNKNIDANSKQVL
jgi:hypothetical protein